MSQSILHPANSTANHATSRSPFLLRNEDNSEITTTSNLLLYAHIGSATTTATHAQNLMLFFVRNDPANSKLHLIVTFIRRASTNQTNVDLISVLEGEHQVTPITPATIRDDSFKLIDALASEGAIFAPYIF